MRILKIQSRSCFPDIEVSQEADGSDLATLASDFNRTDCSETTLCEGDINGDGAVNADDLTLFAVEFGRTNCPHDELYYFHNDHLGTPQRITNQTGTIVWSANYKPFGEAIITTNTITNPFRFPGQYHDQETGLHYNYFRYYDPGMGRYLRGDPTGLGGGINVYSYVSSNPLTAYDIFAKREWRIHRKGLSISTLIVGGSGQLVEFISNCENNIKIIKKYLVVGYGLTVGLKAQVWWDSKGYFGDTIVFGEEPNPNYTGVSVTGPSGGIGMIGGVIGSASLDFTSYAEVHAASKAKIIGVSIFSFEGQLYIPWGNRKVETCCKDN